MIRVVGSARNSRPFIEAEDSTVRGALSTSICAVAYRCYSSRMDRLIVKFKELKRGDRFRFIPADGSGQMTVVESFMGDTKWFVSWVGKVRPDRFGLWYGFWYEDPDRRVSVIRPAYISKTTPDELRVCQHLYTLWKYGPPRVDAPTECHTVPFAEYARFMKTSAF